MAEDSQEMFEQLDADGQAVILRVVELRATGVLTREELGAPDAIDRVMVLVGVFIPQSDRRAVTDRLAEARLVG